MLVGVAVGRFQIDLLHKGHTELLLHVAKESHVLCVVLGINDNRGSKRNPLDFLTRKAMLEEWHRNNNLTIPLVILAQQDQSDDLVWSQNLDQMLAGTFPGSNITLYGARDSFLDSYCGRLRLKDVSDEVLSNDTATFHRLEVATKPEDNASFRRGVIYGCYNQWPRLFMCTDIAIYDKGRDILYLGKRKNEPKLRFFGGFVDQKDVSLEAAAFREAKEEAGLEVWSSRDFLGSTQVPDYRYKSSDEGLVMTAFFLATVNDPKLKAGDDIDELVEIKDFSKLELHEASLLVMPAHCSLMEMLILKVKDKIHG